MSDCFLFFYTHNPKNVSGNSIFTHLLLDEQHGLERSHNFDLMSVRCKSNSKSPHVSIFTIVIDLKLRLILNSFYFIFTKIEMKWWFNYEISQKRVIKSKSWWHWTRTSLEWICNWKLSFLLTGFRLILAIIHKNLTTAQHLPCNYLQNQADIHRVLNWYLHFQMVITLEQKIVQCGIIHQKKAKSMWVVL